MENYREEPVLGFRGKSIYDIIYPTSSSRLSPFRSEFGSPTDDSFALNDGELDEEPECHYRLLPTNLFGRSFDEAWADGLGSILGRRRSRTPSLASDSDSPHPSSPSIASPMAGAFNLSSSNSPTSPNFKPGQQNAVEIEDALVSATQALGIQSSPVITFASGECTEEPPVINIDAPSPPALVEDVRNDSVEQVPPTPEVRAIIQQLLEAVEAAQKSEPSQLLHPTKHPKETPKPVSEEEPERILRSDIKDPTPVLEPHHGRHPRQPKGLGIFTCTQCPSTMRKTFTRRYDLRRHIASVHEVQTAAATLAVTCPVCSETLSRPDAFRRHTAKVPFSCRRLAKLKGKDPPPEREESLYERCREAAKPQTRKSARPSA